MARFEVKISGGDGQNYALFWEGKQVDYVVKPDEANAAIIQWGWIDVSNIVGTVSVVSGEQQVSEAVYAGKPAQCR